MLIAKGEPIGHHACARSRRPSPRPIQSGDGEGRSQVHYDATIEASSNSISGQTLGSAALRRAIRFPFGDLFAKLDEE